MQVVVVTLPFTSAKHSWAPSAQPEKISCVPVPSSFHSTVWVLSEQASGTAWYAPQQANGPRFTQSPVLLFFSRSTPARPNAPPSTTSQSWFGSSGS